MEARILDALNKADPEGRSHCVRYLGSFSHKRHLCLAFEKLGASLCVGRLRRGAPPPPPPPSATARSPPPLRW